MITAVLYRSCVFFCFNGTRGSIWYRTVHWSGFCIVGSQVGTTGGTFSLWSEIVGLSSPRSTTLRVKHVKCVGSVFVGGTNEFWSSAGDP